MKKKDLFEETHHTEQLLDLTIQIEEWKIANLTEHQLKLKKGAIRLLKDLKAPAKGGSK